VLKTKGANKGRAAKTNEQSSRCKMDNWFTLSGKNIFFSVIVGSRKIGAFSSQQNSQPMGRYHTEDGLKLREHTNT